MRGMQMRPSGFHKWGIASLACMSAMRKASCFRIFFEGRIFAKKNLMKPQNMNSEVEGASLS